MKIYIFSKGWCIIRKLLVIYITPFSNFNEFMDFMNTSDRIGGIERFRERGVRIWQEKEKLALLFQLHHIWWNKNLILQLYMYTIIGYNMMLYCAEWGASFLWCAWTRRQLCWRYSSGDDRSKCDRVHWRLTNCDLRWFKCSLSHTLWPKAQRFPVPWASLYCCWTTKEEENQISKLTLSKYLSLLYNYISFITFWLFVVERVWCKNRSLWDRLSKVLCLDCTTLAWKFW